MDGTDNNRFEEALALLEERRYGEAVELFSDVIALNPNLAGAYGNRGLCYLNLGMDEQAASDFETVLQLDPTDAMGYSMLADLARFKGEPEDVLRQVNLALARNPDEPQAHFLRGWLFAQAGQYDLAAEDLGRFLELAGENDDVKDFYDACAQLASNRPGDSPDAEPGVPETAADCLGLRGWSFDRSENRDYEQQGLPCPYAHCIRNCRPLSPETPDGCPVFGNACPGRREQVDWCREHPQMFD